MRKEIYTPPAVTLQKLQSGSAYSQASFDDNMPSLVHGNALLYACSHILAIHSSPCVDLDA